MPSNDNKKSIVGVETNRSNSENDLEQRIVLVKHQQAIDSELLHQAIIKNSIVGVEDYRKACYRLFDSKINRTKEGSFNSTIAKIPIDNNEISSATSSYKFRSTKKSRIFEKLETVIIQHQQPIDPDISSLISIINKFSNDNNEKSSATISSIKIRTTKDSGQMLKEGETKREKLQNESKNNLEKRVGNYIKNKHDKKLISQKINDLKSDIPISNFRINKFSIDNDERSSSNNFRRTKA
ncbi:hypothetical protein HCN44_000660 [Aphidius gifuensis]|uniref:Uncharacterized protein n=1 Tax=Aphidius gifuensis TaxID=684658 RepID=A0A834XPA5_APHGI|nr:hypothetical protein HCN44_000660 [Aphidius gifuensis]